MRLLSDDNHAGPCRVESIEFSRDGSQLVASAKRDNGSGVKKELWLIDAASGQSRYLCDGSNAHWLANRTIVAIHGQYLHLIAAESGLLCCSMPLSIKDSHLMDVARLRLIAGIGSRDGGVALIDLLTGREFLHRHFDGGIRNIVLAPNGASVGITLLDGRSLIWRIDRELDSGRSQDSNETECDNLGVTNAAVALSASFRLSEARGGVEATVECLSKLRSRSLSSIFESLDSDTFAAREGAQKELYRHGWFSLAYVSKAKDSRKLSRETSERLSDILSNDASARSLTDPVCLKMIRACSTLRCSQSAKADEALDRLRKVGADSLTGIASSDLLEGN